jgi:hypothetical protein
LIYERSAMTTTEQTWEWIRPALDELADTSVPWEERRQRALERLGVSQPEDHPVTQELFERLEEVGDEERDTLSHDQLADLALPIVERAVAQQSAAADGGGGYDEGAWQAFLAQNGPMWVGTEGSWVQFRDWFVYSAGEQGLQQPATDLIGYLDSIPANDRVGVFAQYGVTIAGAQAEADAGVQEGAEQESAEQESAEEESAEFDEDQLAAMAEQLAAIPGIENLSAEEIDQLLSAASPEADN